MSLNTYKDEAGKFLMKMHAQNEPLDRKLRMLEAELLTLKDAQEDDNKLQYQVYNMLFTLFEIAFDRDLDLDLEWAYGDSRKQEQLPIDIR